MAPQRNPGRVPARLEVSANWKSRGEMLYFLLRDKVLPSLGSATSSWNGLTDILEGVCGSGGLHAFLRGAVAVHATRQLIVYWTDLAKTTSDEHAIPVVTRFLRTDMFPGIESDLANRVARLVVQAVVVCNHRISPAVQASVYAERTAIRCYLCDRFLLRSSDNDVDRATLEHLWPKSVGGDSTPENLLPACTMCQDAKGDAISWEWFSIQNSVYPPQPEEEMQHISFRLKIARHYHHAMERCERDRSSLKASLVKIGPIHSLRYEHTGRPTTFFDFQTTVVR